MTPMDRAKELVDDLCNDPEVWATHGMPGETKLAIIEVKIAQAITAALISDRWAAAAAGWYVKPRG